MDEWYDDPCLCPNWLQAAHLAAQGAGDDREPEDYEE